MIRALSHRGVRLWVPDDLAEIARNARDGFEKGARGSISTVPGPTSDVAG